MGTRMTIKGQVTIPKAVREAAGIGPGDEVEVTSDGAGTIKVARRDRQHAYRAKINAVRGSLKLGMSTNAYMRLVRGDS